MGPRVFNILLGRNQKWTCFFTCSAWLTITTYGTSTQNPVTGWWQAAGIQQQVCQAIVDLHNSSIIMWQ